MIVQKKNDLEICGAIRFRRNEADKSLANYPMVEKKNYDFGDDCDYHCGPMVTSFTDYIVGDRRLLYDDWLVTDKDGHTKIYTPEEFKKGFERYGGRWSGLVRKVPEQYRAIQFKQESVERYGLAEYPMVIKYEYSAYPSEDNVVKESFSDLCRKSKYVRIAGDTLVKATFEDVGVAEVRTKNGYERVKVPWKGTKTVWVKKHFFFIPYERKVTKPIYDYDAPELYESKDAYLVNRQTLEFGDWIVTDKEGNSKVYTPDDFFEKFEGAKEKD